MSVTRIMKKMGVLSGSKSLNRRGTVAVAMKSEPKRCPIESSVFCDIVDECNPIAAPSLFSKSDEGYFVSDRCPVMKPAMEKFKHVSALCPFDGSPCDVFRMDVRGRNIFGRCVVRVDGFVCDRFDADFNAVLPKEFRKRS